MGLELSEAATAALVERTEGWIAGLQLAALSPIGDPAPDAFIAEFGATDRLTASTVRQSDTESLARRPVSGTGAARRLVGAN